MTPQVHPATPTRPGAFDFAAVTTAAVGQARAAVRTHGLLTPHVVARLRRAVAAAAALAIVAGAIQAGTDAPRASVPPAPSADAAVVTAGDGASPASITVDGPWIGQSMRGLLITGNGITLGTLVITSIEFVFSPADGTAALRTPLAQPVVHDDAATSGSPGVAAMERFELPAGHFLTGEGEPLRRIVESAAARAALPRLEDADAVRPGRPIDQQQALVRLEAALQTPTVQRALAIFGAPAQFSVDPGPNAIATPEAIMGEYNLDVAHRDADEHRAAIAAAYASEAGAGQGRDVIRVYPARLYRDEELPGLLVHELAHRWQLHQRADAAAAERAVAGKAPALGAYGARFGGERDAVEAQAAEMAVAFTLLEELERTLPPRTQAVALVGATARVYPGVHAAMAFLLGRPEFRTHPLRRHGLPTAQALAHAAAPQIPRGPTPVRGSGRRRR